MITLTKPHPYFLAKSKNRPAQQNKCDREQQGSAKWL
jgi:hypothetical protein